MADATGSKVWTVYRYYDAADQLLYVGVTGTGPLRAHGHARSRAAWWPLVVRGEFQHFTDPVEAFTEELRQIVELAPLYNVADNPRRQVPRQSIETKRSKIEQRLAGLTTEQRVTLGQRGIAADLAEEGVSVSEQYVGRVMSGALGGRNGHGKP